MERGKVNYRWGWGSEQDARKKKLLTKYFPNILEQEVSIFKEGEQTYLEPASVPRWEKSL